MSFPWGLRRELQPTHPSQMDLRGRQTDTRKGSSRSREEGRGRKGGEGG